MDSRRDFLKKAAMLGGAAGLSSMLPPSIQRALAIDPEAGTSFLDAEHVVILMQENRSFDHCFGTLQGVRGFNDPRAIRLPNNNPVWLQTNEAGETYAPFRLNIKDTKATWMGSLPHSWTDQTDARNNGLYDKWLTAKKSGHKEYASMPLTLGYYNREDLPFYYSLADAFTICDQAFCSSLTGTTPNRLFLWTGTIRDRQDANASARVFNGDTDYDKPAYWKTFPERLEDNNISWKIYQNEISVGVGFDSEEDAWLSNFTDNPIEWFAQYHVKFSQPYIKNLPKKIASAESAISVLEDKLKSLSPKNALYLKTRQELHERKAELKTLHEERKKLIAKHYQKLSDTEKNLHAKAFTTNINDLAYHTLTTLTYKEGDEEREVKVPKGDVLYQFRSDVDNGKLPTVSWLVAPENYSDHPGAPWYGAWYVSEVMDILTKNPEVWKKTIFILCYDENDGYFDHVPPFVPPHPNLPDHGLVSKGIDTSIEYVMREHELKRRPEEQVRESSIGLGYRVPLIIASPWSRGGVVNSQVFDHTSILQFLEIFTSHKSGKKIEETNISAWRRTICGDLTSVFQPYKGDKFQLPSFLAKDKFITEIHQAKFRKLPSTYKSLSKEEIEQINTTPVESEYMPQQERGVRRANALPYQLYAEGKLTADKTAFEITLEASNKFFGEKAAGSPFHIYRKNINPRAYAVKAGDQLSDNWKINTFEQGHYQLQVYGPNGFFRSFTGSGNDPALDSRCNYNDVDSKLPGNVEIVLTNQDSKPLKVSITDNAYKSGKQTHAIEAGKSLTVTLDLSKNLGWYDFTITVVGDDLFMKHYTGRVETGKSGFTDPAMGHAI
ncbi:MAG TPA: phospholipase C, phosphocholine-specific [Cyclobacteriaceae bacterium]|nr:phospholipase C, phosphocholine-specific [Cyclobacteriaceae bacterium]